MARELLQLISLAFAALASEMGKQNCTGTSGMVLHLGEKTMRNEILAAFLMGVLVSATALASSFQLVPGHVYANTDSGIQEYDAHLQPVATLSLPGATVVEGVAFTPAGTLILGTSKTSQHHVLEIGSQGNILHDLNLNVGGLDRTAEAAVDSSGRAYVATTGGVVEITPDFASFRTLPYTFGRASGVAVGPDGKLYVSDQDNANVVVFDVDRRYERKFSVGDTPTGMSFGPDGNLYLGLFWDGIARVDLAAQHSTLFLGTSNPCDVVFAPDGTYYLSHAYGHVIERRSTQNGLLDSTSTGMFSDSIAIMVPEPATLSLLALGGVLLARRRRAVHSLAALLLAAGVLGYLQTPASADVLNMGGTRDPASGHWTGSASLEFVTVDDPRNALDVNYYGWGAFGAVPYTYQIGRYDVTAAQYCQFLNSVASLSDPYGLYYEYMGNEATNGCGIVRSGTSGTYVYNVKPGQENIPVNFVSWASAARFCNWLANRQPIGPQGTGTTETGSYSLNGTTSADALMAITRNPGATYVIPTADEWYKAAYYKGGGTNAGYWLYPTRSNGVPSNVLSGTGTNNANYYKNGYTIGYPGYVTPVGSFAGSPGPYGTYDMAGNVWQWTETNLYGWYRGWRGGSFANEEAYFAAWSFNSSGIPDGRFTGVGFRVALVPEPATLSLLALGGVLLARRRRA